MVVVVVVEVVNVLDYDPHISNFEGKKEIVMRVEYSNFEMILLKDSSEMETRDRRKSKTKNNYDQIEFSFRMNRKLLMDLVRIRRDNDFFV